MRNYQIILPWLFYVIYKLPLQVVTRVSKNIRTCRQFPAKSQVTAVQKYYYLALFHSLPTIWPKYLLPRISGSTWLFLSSWLRMQLEQQVGYTNFSVTQGLLSQGVFQGKENSTLLIQQQPKMRPPKTKLLHLWLQRGNI